VAGSAMEGNLVHAPPKFLAPHEEFSSTLMKDKESSQDRNIYLSSFN
jgi:hypothetical protein